MGRVIVRNSCSADIFVSLLVHAASTGQSLKMRDARPLNSGGPRTKGSGGWTAASQPAGRTNNVSIHLGPSSIVCCLTKESTSSTVTKYLCSRDSKTSMTSDIRVNPFTEEEVARLNEKVKNMKFSRPPPRLPTPRVHSKATTSQNQTTSLPQTPQTPQTSAEVERSLCGMVATVVDNEVRSYGSDDQDFKLPWRNYMCDGMDWIQELSDKDDSPVKMDKNRDHDYSSSLDNMPDVCEMKADSPVDREKVEDDSNDLKSCPSSTVDCDEVIVDSCTIHPKETISDTRSIVHNQQLQSKADRERDGFRVVPECAEGTIGMFKKPTYGRLLLNNDFPMESMKHIMNSAVENLTAYFNKPQSEPLQSAMNSESDGPTSVADTSVPNENVPKNQDTTEAEPVANGIKRARRSKRKGRNKTIRKANNGVVLNSDSTKDSPQNSLENQQALENMKKKRKRKLSIVSTTSDGPKKSFKIVIRRDVSTEIASRPVAENGDKTVSSAMRSSGDTIVQNGESSLSNTVTENTSTPAAQQTTLQRVRSTFNARLSNLVKQSRILERTMEDVAENVENNTTVNAAASVTETPLSSEAVVDDDVIVIHESIKNKSKKSASNCLTLEESSLVGRLAALINVRSVNIQQNDWFEDLCWKGQQFENHLDRQLGTLWRAKAELLRRRGQQMMERTRCLSLLHKHKNDLLAYRNESFRMRSDAIAKEILSQCSQKSANLRYLPLEDGRYSQPTLGLRVDQGPRQHMPTTNNTQAVAPHHVRPRIMIPKHHTQQVNEGTSSRCVPVRLSPRQRVSSSSYTPQAFHEKSNDMPVNGLKPPSDEVVPRDPMPSSSAAMASQKSANTSSDPSVRMKATSLSMEQKKSHPPFQVNSPKELTTGVPFGVPSGTLAAGQQPQETRVIAKSASVIPQPRYILKNGVRYERKYAVAPTGHRVKPFYSPTSSNQSERFESS
ncbi:hypothetical protein KIN20_037004 [Parelaphostrongylus tenuis]|uniref:Uncharacterized protein n=1 Tax=Parelaphostrongylus tenuis TaxID=148309 RepID=A0AAD5RDB4_PARTN|nr:hypothetical protein KIN20_037004 [Parelaphostrongylus tenuis]